MNISSSTGNPVLSLSALTFFSTFDGLAPFARISPYKYFLVPKDHGDPKIAKAQQWIENHQTDHIDYEKLSKKLGISRRSLERRFKQALDVTPMGYQQKLRVDHAKRMLEEGTQVFNEITYRVGYEEISFFRKVFIRLTGLKSEEYQQRFSGFPRKTAL